MMRGLFTTLVVAGSLSQASVPSAAAEQVAFAGNYPAGTIVVRTGERHLYYVTMPGRALRYSVAVGRQGRQWAGRTEVARMIRNPSWAPPPVVRRDKPWLPDLVPPGPSNPLGAAVLVLGDGTYGIHGTNKASSIGTEASYGCIRLYNKEILDLFQRVSVGTPVLVQP